MDIPSQGFRHAVTLLLTSRVRALPPPDSPDTPAAVCRIAQELVALANDMNAPPQAAEWLTAEFERMVGFVRRECDLSQAKQILAATGTMPRFREACDLFLMYVPEDRLTIAAPFAIELTKRRISVAFSEYETATEEELKARLRSGLEEHRAGAVLVTPEFSRKQWPLDIADTPRFRVIRDPRNPATVARTANWVKGLVSGKNTVFI